MRQAISRALKSTLSAPHAAKLSLSPSTPLSLLQLQRYLYVVSESEASAKVIRKFEFEGTVKFAVFSELQGTKEADKKEIIAVAHEQDKLVKFYEVEQLLAQEEGSTISVEPLYQYKNWKKITALEGVKFSQGD